MEQNIQFTSTRHQRIENEWEQSPSYVMRQVKILRSDNFQRIAVSIQPTLSTKYATLWETTNIFSGEKVCQDITTANVLKYIGDDPDYTFYVRNKESFALRVSHFVPSPFNLIDTEFSEDEDLLLVIERQDINVILKYYK